MFNVFSPASIIRSPFIPAFLLFGLFYAVPIFSWELKSNRGKYYTHDKLLNVVCKYVCVRISWIWSWLCACNLININSFCYPNSRLSGLFACLTISPDNRGCSVFFVYNAGCVNCPHIFDGNKVIWYEMHYRFQWALLKICTLTKHELSNLPYRIVLVLLRG